MSSVSATAQTISKSYERTACLIARYLYQILVGCEDSKCNRTYCKSAGFQSAFGDKTLRKQAVLNLAMEIAGLRGSTQLCKGYELNKELPLAAAELVNERDPLRSPILTQETPSPRPVAVFWKKDTTLSSILPDESGTTLLDLENRFSKIKSTLQHDSNIFSIRHLINLLNSIIISIESGRNVSTDSSKFRNFLTRIVEATDMNIWRFLNIQLEPKTPSTDTIYPRVLAIKTLQSWAPNSKSAPRSFHSRLSHILDHPKTEISNYKYYELEMLPQYKLPSSAIDVFTPNWALVKPEYSVKSDAPLNLFFDLPSLVSVKDRVTMVRYLCFRRMEAAAKQLELTNQAKYTICNIMRLEDDLVYNPIGRNSTSNMYRTFLLRLPRSEMVLTVIYFLSQIKNWEVCFMPLKVEFEDGEIGVDVGGVQVEFFDQLGRELMSPDIGLFAYDESHVPWIDDDFHSSYWETVGVMFGLAVHNGCTLPVDLPVVFYKLLIVGTRSGNFSASNFRPDDITLEDFAEVFPTIAKSLRNLKRLSQKDFKSLDLKFVCTFYSQHTGKDVAIKLPSFRKYPKNAVTIDNVSVYVREYMLVRLCFTYEKLENFCTSFLFFLPARVLRAFSPIDLKYMVEGRPVKMQFVQVLRKITTYDNYNRDSPVVRMFWQLLETRFSLEDIKRLVMFVTGTDRLPVGDLKNFEFTIGKLGDGSDSVNLIPTASVCTSRLLLPEYKSLEQMEKMVRLALENATGFGLG